MEKCLKIDREDNVIVALEDINAGTAVDVSDDKDVKKSNPIVAVNDIPAGHKMAITDIPSGSSVIKYGEPIGRARTDIRAGEHVHVHNLATRLDETVSYSYEPVLQRKVSVPGGLADTFKGFRRAFGAGIRNEIWIIPTVGCVNNIATGIARLAEPFVKGSVDTVVAFPHPYGCSQMGDDQENTRQILADLIRHPNAGGVLVLGLGCENSNIDVLKPYIGEYDQNRIRFLVSQQCEDELAEGLSIVKELIETASKDVRTDIPVSELIVGLKCGGSDGFSGITANPLVGSFSDYLISKQGTTILTEVPEMFGAETLLMNRCKDEELFEKTVKLINDFKDYFKSHGQTVYENPSPGNKAGGISTLEDKSLGCTQKSGTTPVCGVLAYGQRVSEKGLNLLSAPGNDLVAATALAASGAQLVLFTTGRGTPFASPVPTVKISSNTGLFERKANWIDFNAGELLESADRETLAARLYEYVIRVAGGEYVSAERAGYHDMAIFKQGVTL
ncbi:MAG: altronate dehydratase family protein [Lachnospiraceae bacterium]|nr:altronate dehydratase family protein [Lachnospiraceae bacterium]